MSNISDYITMDSLDFQDKPFSVELGHLFSVNNRINNEAIFNYISVGQCYWVFRYGHPIQIRITHKYGGVIFYVTENSVIDCSECHFDVGSVLGCTMIPCKIYRYELAYNISLCRNMETEEVYESLKKHGFYIPEGLEVEII